MLTETKLENNKNFLADLKLSFCRFFKLLKYELSASCKTLVPIYCAVLVIGVLTRFAVANKVDFESSSFSIYFEMKGIMEFLCFSLLTAAVCISIVILTGRFKKSFFGSEAYLNFSLPVGVSNHLASKLVSCIIWGIACTAVGLVSSLTAWNGWGNVSYWFENENVWSVLGICSGYILWLSSGILLFFLAMCTGHIVPKFKRVVEILIVIVGLTIEGNVAGYVDNLSSSDAAACFIVFGVPVVFSAIWFAICYLILRFRLDIE
ncbi:MAG: hypothetical protein J6U06_05050 [Spirochaetaceae bacterium]|nr:hypothetical protein [Spirochaetaceae bacterium]